MEFKIKIKQALQYSALTISFFIICLIIFLAVPTNAESVNHEHPDWGLLIQAGKHLEYPYKVKIGLKENRNNQAVTEDTEDKDYRSTNLSIQFEGEWLPVHAPISKHRDGTINIRQKKINLAKKNLQLVVNLKKDPLYIPNEHPLDITVITENYNEVQFVNIGKEDLLLEKEGYYTIIYLGDRTKGSRQIKSERVIENLKFAVIGDNESFNPLLWGKKKGRNWYLEESIKGIHCSETNDEGILQYCFYALPELIGAKISVMSEDNPKDLITQKVISKSGVINVSNNDFKDDKGYHALIEKGEYKEVIKIHSGIVNYIPNPVVKETGEEFFQVSDESQESSRNVDITLILNVDNATVTLKKPDGSREVYKEPGNIVKFSITINTKKPYQLIVKKKGFHTYDGPLLTEEERLIGQKEYQKSINLPPKPFVTFKLIMNETNAFVKIIEKNGSVIKDFGKSPDGKVSIKLFFNALSDIKKYSHFLLIEKEGHISYKMPLLTKEDKLSGKTEFEKNIPLPPSSFILNVLAKDTKSPLSQVSTQIHFKSPDSPIYSVLPDKLYKAGENGNIEIDGDVRNIPEQKLLVLSHNNYQTHIETFKINGYENIKKYRLYPKKDHSYKVEFDMSKEESEVRFLFAEDPNGKKIMNAFNYHSNYTVPYIDNDWVYKEINFSLVNGFSVKENDQYFVNLQSATEGIYDADRVLEDRFGNASIGYINMETEEIQELKIPENKVVIETPEEITNILIEDIKEGKFYTALKTHNGFEHPILEKWEEFNLYAIDNEREPYYIPSWQGVSDPHFVRTFVHNLKGIKLVSNFNSNFDVNIKGNLDNIAIDEYRYSDDNGILYFIFEGDVDNNELEFSPTMNNYKAEKSDSSSEGVITLPIRNADDTINSGPQQIDFKVYNIFFKPIVLNIVIRNFSGITNKVFRKALKHLIENFQNTGQWEKVNLYHAISSRTLKPILLDDLNSYFRDIYVTSESKALGTFTTIENLNEYFTKESKKIVQVLYITPEDQVFSFKDGDYEKKLDKISIFELIQKDVKTVNHENFKKLADKMDGVYLQGNIGDLRKIHLEPL